MKPIPLSSLGPHAIRQIRDQVGDKVKIQKEGWQGLEKDLQRAVNRALKTMGYAPRASKTILATEGRGGVAGWYIHVNRAPGNPILLDVLILHKSGRWMEIELKTATGKPSECQAALLTQSNAALCRSVEAVVKAVQKWEATL